VPAVTEAGAHFPGHVSDPGEWGLPVDLNERRFVQRAGRDEIQPLLARPSATGAELCATLATVSATLHAAPFTAR